MSAGVFSFEGKNSQARKVKVAGRLYPLSLVERVDKDEAGLPAIREQNVALIKERISLVCQQEALKHEVSSLQRKAETTTRQSYLWKNATD